MLTIAKNLKPVPLISNALLLAGIMALSACGGGGGESGPNSASSSSSSNSSSNSSTSSSSSGGNSCVNACVRFNEAVASNSSLDDEDGDSPDWFELYNTTSEAIDLSGWTLSDDNDEPNMWTLPSLTLEAGGYLKIWASDKDKKNTGVHRTLVSNDDLFRYSIIEPSTDWKELSFNDSSWQQGRGGFGYGDGDDTTLLSEGTQTVYLRNIFQISGVTNIEEMWLDIDYDDAFVAYLNGVEIARANILGDAPGHNASVITDREATMYQSGMPHRFSLNDFSALLAEGDNVLSIQVHNISNTSSDLSAIPFLTARYNTHSIDGVAPPEVLGFEDYHFHTNFKISSGGETLYLYNADGAEVDALQVPALITDVSVGISNSNGHLVYYQDTTPGEQNASNEYDGFISSELSFSHNGGATSASTVSISGAASGEHIRYTTDASVPQSDSSQYSSAIPISSNTVVRARIFRSGYIPSRTFSRTYLPTVHHDLPIVALVSEPDNFFDSQTGLYVEGLNASWELPYFGANFWQDWERDVHFSFYETNGSLGLAMNAGVKIFGGWSRANAQRSMSIYARGRYGVSDIDYPLFPELPYQEFQSVVLRNSGNDWMNTMMRDATLTSLMADSGLEVQAFRPVAVYLNGEYWGLYNLREKVSEHFLASKHSEEAEALDILEREGAVVDGSNDDYLELVQFVENNSLASTANYNRVANDIDIENFITYYVAQIYFNNQDWPGNNIKYWRAPGGKWRWILYDTDFGFGIWNQYDYSADTLAFALQEFGPEWPNPPWSTLLFRRLMENDTFKNHFIRRFNDELNTRFAPSHVVQHIEATAAQIEAEIPQQWTRWQDHVEGVYNWETQVDNMKTFAQERAGWMIDILQNTLSAGNLYTLEVTLNNTSRGSVRLNSIEIDASSWSGEYFGGIPLEATAIPAAGYAFSHWEGASTGTNVNTTFSLSADMTLTAVFIAQ